MSTGYILHVVRSLRHGFNTGLNQIGGRNSDDSSGKENSLQF
jgi:hypothetical protein